MRIEVEMYALNSRNYPFIGAVGSESDYTLRTRSHMVAGEFELGGTHARVQRGSQNVDSIAVRHCSL